MRLRLCIVALVVALVSLSSCSLPFYWQAVGGQVELLRKRVPIDEVLADPGADGELKESLLLVSRIRAFAGNTLLLPSNDSYTAYADLERPYVVWNVVAAPEFSIVPETSCFPFAGCVSYRGFFSRDKALAYADKLAARGLDTYVGGANAYSTLGYFSDPVLNTMLVNEDFALAALLFHELAHQKIYVKGDSELSEAFASVIEEYGTRRWLDANGDTAGLARYAERIAQRSAFAELVVEHQRRLAGIYAGPGDNAEKRRAKTLALTMLREDFARAKREGRLTDSYNGWFAQSVNNATLASVATYRLWVPGLRWRLEAAGLEGFYAEIEALAARDADERVARLTEWNERALASAAGGSSVARQP